jgi:hypothetical protein
MRAALLLAALVCTPAFANPTAEPNLQRDVIAYHLAKGESRADVCAVVEVYFDVHCTLDGDDFVLTRGVHLDTTYLAILNFPSVKTP